LTSYFLDPGLACIQIHINDNFAKFSEALYIADRHAREEVRERALMQQRLAQKEKAAKEENLRLLAQRAREERSGITTAAAGDVKPVERGVGLGGYGSDSDSDSDSDASDATAKKPGKKSVAASSDEDEDSDDEAAKEREKIRREKRQEREREMRLNNMGSEQRAKMLMK
jgi:SNW domain-containing protein 1